MSETPGDLIGLADAARLVPSSRAGKRTHVSTIWRWVQGGRLRGWKLGRLTFVSKGELLGLFKPVQTRQDRDRWTRETLERFRV